jgi:hypothetical protein
LLFSCKQNKVQETTIQQVPVELEESVDEGTPMSDSMIASIIKGSSPEANKPPSLDLSQCQKVSSVVGLQFTMDSIAKYHLQVDNYVEHCLYEVERGDKKTYILFNNDIEAHYSPYFKMLTVAGQDTLQIKTLCQIYGNEQMDYVVSAKGVDNATFELTTDYTYVYIHGIGKVDSTRSELERVSF